MQRNNTYKSKVKRTIFFLITAVFTVSFLLTIPSPASAAECTWDPDGGGVAPDYRTASTADNWQNCGGDAPGVGDNATIDQATSTAITWDIAVISNLTVGSNYSGTVELAAQLNASSTISIVAGTLDSNGNKIVLDGDWSNFGTFTANSDTVAFSGVSQTIYGTTTFNNLTVDQSNNDESTDQTITLEESLIQTVSGILTLNGLDANDMVNIRSATGTQAYFKVTGATVNADFADIKDNHLIKGNNTEIDPSDSTNSGNTHLWFTIDPPGNGTVESFQKISDREGDFAATLGGSDFFSSSVANIGDLNGDGIQDLAVGAHGDGDGGSLRGAVYILFMGTDGKVDDYQKISDTEGDFTATLDNSGGFNRSAQHIRHLPLHVVETSMLR